MSMASNWMKALTIAGAVSLAQPALSYDWQGISHSYNQWTVSTMNTAMVNRSMNPNARRTPVPAWPGITQANVGTHVFTPVELNAMRQNNLQRSQSMLEGRRITIEGTARRATKTLLWVDDPTNTVPYAGHVSWRGGPIPQFPANGSRVRIEGLVRKVGMTWVELREARILSAGARSAVAPSRPVAQPRSASRPAAPAASAASLRFARSAAVTRQANEKIASGMVGALSAGRTEQDLLRVLNSGTLQTGFRNVLKQYGRSENDLADVMSTHLILLWQVANNQRRYNMPRGYDVIRNELRAELSRAQWISALSDRDKQMMAEMLSTGTMLIVGRYIDGTDNGNRPALTMAISDARAMAREVAGIDLTTLNLTERGFVRK